MQIFIYNWKYVFDKNSLLLFDDFEIISDAYDCCTLFRINWSIDSIIIFTFFMLSCVSVLSIFFMSLRSSIAAELFKKFCFWKFSIFFISFRFLMIVISSFCLYVMSKSEVIFKFSHKIFRHFTKNSRYMKLSSTLSDFVFVTMSSIVHKHELIWFFINVVLSVKSAKTHDRNLLNDDNVISKSDIFTSKFFVKNKIFNDNKFLFCLRFRRRNFVRWLL